MEILRFEEDFEEKNQKIEERKFEVEKLSKRVELSDPF